MYLENATRPDVAFTVKYLARKLNPTEVDWNDLRRILKYLRGTSNLGIKYHSNLDTLETMTDASFSDCEGSGFTAGYIIRLFGDIIA